MKHRFARMALAAMTISAGVTATAGQASAARMDTDQVNASVAGSSITGYVMWPSYYGGRGQITVHNDMTDGLCVTAQQRVKRNGTWSNWKDVGPVLCTKPTNTVPVWIDSNNQRVQYWQFRVRDANSPWAYDTNSPGLG